MKVDDLLRDIVSAKNEDELNIVRSDIEMAETQSLISALDGMRLAIVINIANNAMLWRDTAYKLCSTVEQTTPQT